MNTCILFAILVCVGTIIFYHVGVERHANRPNRLNPPMGTYYGPAARWRVVRESGQIVVQFATNEDDWITQGQRAGPSEDGAFYAQGFPDVASAERSAKDELARRQARSLPDGVLSQS